MSKKIILIIVIVVVLGVIIYQFFIKDEEPEFALEKVVIGMVLKEVSETGTVKISEEINLSFKNSGRIDEIYVKVGDNVEAGQKLAKLDTSQLYIELTEAQAALEVARAKKTDTEISLKNAEQNLKDVKADAEEDLNSACEDALNVLDDSYLKTYDAYNAVYEIQRDYFTSFDEKSTEVIEEKYKIKSDLERIEAYVNDAKNNPQEENIDLILSKVKEQLEAVSNSLEIVRDITESEAYRSSVSTTDKTSLDTQRTNIINVIADIVNAQQTISTTKIVNETNINNAEAESSLIKNKLQEGGLYQAQISQAQAKVSLLQNKIQEAVLKSFNGGQIIKINKREGEVVQPTDSVISFLSVGPFQIEVDIYEEDIVDVKVNNPVEITLAAFSDEILKGRVISIDPAEKLIGGIVYYGITIDFEETKEGIKPGMTADIIIESDKKENVLVIPKRAVKKMDGKKIVQVFKDGEVKEREIEIGLEGDEFFEIISGLSEGEEVVIE
ncbi:efflux RND transporter periplasmic adaptor subunit [Patescibacteria group bacterium]|nr:efflux RND transporter periplasmic adaptor subunit [Patescibacteria group bacterium]